MESVVSLVAVQMHIPDGAVQDRREKSQRSTIVNGKKYLRAGQFLTIPSDHKKELEALRKEISTTCREVGTRVMGLWVVPRTRSEELLGQLERLQVKFIEARKRYIDGYEEAVRNWANDSENEEIRDQILRHSRSKISIETEIRFNYWSFEATTLAETENGGVESAAKDALVHEIAVDATTLWRKSLDGKDKKDRRVLRTLSRLRQKAEGFICLDSRFSRICDEIDCVLDAMPKTGAIVDDELLRLKKLTRQLMDEDGLQQTILDRPKATNEEHCVSEGVANLESSLPEAFNW